MYAGLVVRGLILYRLTDIEMKDATRAVPKTTEIP